MRDAVSLGSRKNATDVTRSASNSLNYLMRFSIEAHTCVKSECFGNRGRNPERDVLSPKLPSTNQIKGQMSRDIEKNVALIASPIGLAGSKGSSNLFTS